MGDDSDVRDDPALRGQNEAVLDDEDAWGKHTGVGAICHVAADKAN